ncbi:CAP domain-containing protein [Spirillospora sp. NPDC047279]|uniref:CAP domain-containing protein n=1 Tax=Spirillospora sp. NPDC047279 TaxID=3155478 RepID=UPI0033E429BF
MVAVTLAAAAATLAIGTGVALDRLVLPELRSEAASTTGATGTAGRRGPSGTGFDTSGGTPVQKTSSTPKTPNDGGAPSASQQPPSLKPLRGRAQPSASPSSSSSPSAARTPGDATPPPSPAAAESTVVRLTNKERTKAGCPALRTDKRLTTAAREHSADMAANDYFDHTSRAGETPWERMEDAGYPSPGAENIAKGYLTAEAVVEGWMKSPGHRANILNCRLRAIGVGMVEGSGGPWWTQDFGWQ